MKKNLYFKNDKNLVNFDPSTQKSFIGSCCAKYLKFDLKKYRGVIFHDNEEDAKFEEKLTCGLENEIRNIANFHQSTWKSQNWEFDGVF